MKNSFDERNLKEINNWLKAGKKIALATVTYMGVVSTTYWKQNDYQ